jgi:hypothetical protein
MKRRRCFRVVDSVLDEAPKLIAIGEEANRQIVMLGLDKPLEEQFFHFMLLPHRAEATSLRTCVYSNPSIPDLAGMIMLAHKISPFSTTALFARIVLENPMESCMTGALAPRMVSWHADAAASLTPQATRRRRGGRKGFGILIRRLHADVRPVPAEAP